MRRVTARFRGPCGFTLTRSRQRVFQYDLDGSDIRLRNLLNLRVIRNNSFETNTGKVTELVRAIQKTNLRQTSLSKRVIQS